MLPLSNQKLPPLLTLGNFVRRHRPRTVKAMLGNCPVALFDWALPDLQV